MTTATKPAADAFRQIVLSDAEFADIAARAYNDFGLHLHDGKKDLVHARLVRRLRVLNMGSFSEYVSLLDRPEGQEERLQMLSALTTNVTHFFRESHHFDILTEQVLPPLLSRIRSGGRLRIWSAGCSAGQEPYSIAATVLKAIPDARDLDVLILATDVDPQILGHAERGEYRREDLDALPATQYDLLFGGDQTGDHLKIREDVRSLIRFGVLNLIEDWPMKGRFDVIFCRNVAIYFDKPTQSRLWQRFSDLLSDPGFLMIGHSERLSKPAIDQFDAVGTTAFKKKSRDAQTTTTLN